MAALAAHTTVNSLAVRLQNVVGGCEQRQIEIRIQIVYTAKMINSIC